MKLNSVKRKNMKKKSYFVLNFPLHRFPSILTGPISPLRSCLQKILVSEKGFWLFLNISFSLNSVGATLQLFLKLYMCCPIVHQNITSINKMTITLTIMIITKNLGLHLTLVFCIVFCISTGCWDMFENGTCMVIIMMVALMMRLSPPSCNWLSEGGW